MGLEHHGRGHLIGRSSDVEAVRRRLAGAVGGSGDVVLIEGEPGIGKTRFLDQLLSELAGLRTFRAEADELDRTRPFAPLSDALDCRRASPDPLRADIARLIDEGAAEFRIVERFAELLERMALAGPLLVAIDDLQWADVSTVTALRFASRHLGDVPVSFLLAARPIPRGLELASFVDGSIRAGAMHVILGDLSEDAVAALVEDIVGCPPGPRLRSLVASAGGSPFYVTEVVRALEAEGRLHRDDGVVEADTSSVPAAFRGSVVRYVRFLSDSQLSLLRWAAVLGSHFTPADLATVSGEPIEAVLQVVDDAMRAGIVVHDGDRLAFRHDLLREALYDDMGPAAQRSRHLAAGRALARGGASAQDVAYHFLRAPAVEDDMAVDWLLGAARRTIDLGTRAELLGAALDRLAPGDERGAPIAAEAITCLGGAGRVADAEVLAVRLRPHLGAGGAARLSAALAAVYAQQTDPASVLRHCEAARHDPSLPHDLRANLIATEGFALLVAGRVREAEAAGRRAVEAGTHDGDRNALLAGREVLCLCALAAGRSRDAAAMAVETARVWPSEMGPIILQMALLNEDRLLDVTELFRTSRARLLESGYLVAMPALQVNCGLALLLAGRLDDAQIEAEAGLALAEHVNVRVVTAVARGVISRVALHRGSLREAQAALGSLQHVPELGGTVLQWARALLLEAQGDVSAACEVLASTWDSPLRSIATPAGPDVVRLHLAAGDRHRASSVTADLERDARRSDARSAAGAALRCRALLEGDPALMREAIACYEDGPRVLETASTREDAASLLGGDAAVEQLQAALAAYETAGATRDVTRVRASLRERGVRLGVRGARQRPTTGWDSLTPAERQVTALAAEGLTSRQIGDRLYISTFTVGSHLRHIYQKLGINSRLQLAAEARRHPLDGIA